MADSVEPVHLIEQAETGDRFLIYTDDKGVRVDLRHDGDALWMTQGQMAQLFGRDVSAISRHIANILEEGELVAEGNLQFMQIARSTKPVALYSLDMVISVGYRVSSAQATVFRRWATSVLVRFATSGFVVDVERLKEPGRLTTMDEARQRLDDSLRNVGRVVLAHGGQVSAQRAKAAAEQAYETFDERRKQTRQADAADELAALKAAAKALPKAGLKKT